MGSPSRFINFSARSGQSENATDPTNPQPQVFAVAPLNSAPYIGPAMTQSQAASMPARKDSEVADRVGPAMIYMPCQSTTKEWDTLVAATQSGIALTGSAALGKVGPAIGLLDIGECEDSYLFRVSLPGVAREKDFSCEIEPDGKVMIKGITMTGEKIVCKNSLIFDMQTQNLCPPGHFSITFYLPGAVDHQQYSGYFGIDGILEGIVKKT